MQNFKCLSAAIDPQPLLQEVAQVDEAWGLSTGRQQKIEVQRESLSIPIRGLRCSAINERARRDVHESRWTNGSASFPRVRQLIEYWAQQTESLPGRAKIVCLPAGKRVYPHVDRGEYYRLHNRYHCVLKSSHGSWLKAGEEEVYMQEGELWWFDNQAIHEAFNKGTEDRIHIIFDLLPEVLAAEAFASSQMEAA